MNLNIGDFCFLIDLTPHFVNDAGHWWREHSPLNKQPKMKITIEITEAEANGIKDYLREVGDIEQPTKEDIKREIDGIVKGYFQAQQSSLTDYINKYL